METDYPGCQSLITRSFHLREISAATIKIILASITNATWKQYNSSLKRWWIYCKYNSLNPLSGDVNTLLKFFTCEFDKGASYGTLNTVRSALSFLLSPELIADSKIRRFFKGVYMLRPCAPRYDFTWDPEIVLKHLNSIDSQKTSLDILTKKLAVLLALATAHRAQTLSLIDVRNIIFGPDSIEIKIPDRIKTSRRNTFQPILVLKFFSQKPNICVAKNLQIYLERTQSIRPNSCQRLFLTLKRPYRESTAQTLCRWIKDMLTKCGIDTTIFSAHSTRHASSSAAFRKGVSLDVIKRTAGWSNSSSTFAKFYNRPIRTSNNFECSVLD